MKPISNKSYLDLIRSIPVILANLPVSSDAKLENAKRLLKIFIIKNK